MGLPKHVKRFVYAEIRSLDFYRREMDFQKNRIEEIGSDLDAVILPQQPEGDKVQGGKPTDPAQLKRLYLQEELEQRRERLKVLQRKMDIVTDALNVLDPERDHAIRWAAEADKDRAPLWQVAERYHVCEKTIYRWQIEAVERLAPLMLGVFGR